MSFDDEAHQAKKSVAGSCNPLALVVAARADTATDIRIHLIALPERYASKAASE